MESGGESLNAKRRSLDLRGFDAIPEDMGAWTAVVYYSTRKYETEDEAVVAAAQSVQWLAGLLEGQK